MSELRDAISTIIWGTNPDAISPAEADEAANLVLALPQLASVGRDRSSQSQPSADAGPEARARTEAEGAAARDTFFEDQLAEAQADPEWRAKWASGSAWRPICEAPEKPGTYINVRSVTTYRWLEYKPDGQRQMGRKGRWQIAANEYGGWANAKLPENGEFRPNEPLPAPLPNTPLSAGKEGC